MLLLFIVQRCQLDLPNPANGIVTCSQGKEYGSLCRFYCDQGHISNKEEIYGQVGCELLGGKLQWVFIHPDVPEASNLVLEEEQLPKCPRMLAN